MTDRPTAVVTGAARGIGAAVVRKLADAGWNVVAVDLCDDDPAVPYPLGTSDELRRLAKENDGVIALAGDVRDLDALEAAVRQALDRYGRVDAAVGAAAVILGGTPVWETTDEQWNTLFDTDVAGVLNLARAAVPAMLPARRGRFVALASAAAHHGLWHLGAYCAAKHAVLGLVRGLAADLRGTGISAVAGLRASRTLIFPVARSIAASASSVLFSAMALIALVVSSIAATASWSRLLRA